MHVDYLKGTKHHKCGTKKKPCKHLNAVIEKINLKVHGGKVSVKGEQRLSKPITLKKDVVIVGNGNARISNRYGTKSKHRKKRLNFAFKASGSSQITFSSIDFVDIGIIQFTKSTDLVIKDIKARNFEKTLILIPLQFRYSISIEKSLFHKTGKVIKCKEKVKSRRKKNKTKKKTNTHKGGNKKRKNKKTKRSTKQQTQSKNKKVTRTAKKGSQKKKKDISPKTERLKAQNKAQQKIRSGKRSNKPTPRGSNGKKGDRPNQKLKSKKSDKWSHQKAKSRPKKSQSKLHANEAVIRNSKFINTKGFSLTSNSTFSMSDCQLTENVADKDVSSPMTLKKFKKVIIIKCVFKGNRGMRGGSLMLSQIKDTNITKCKFISSRSSNMGGAIAIDNIGLICNIMDCLFEKNIAGIGGAIFNTLNARYSGKLRSEGVKKMPMASMTKVVFRNNIGRSHGQAIYSKGKIILRDVKIESLEKCMSSHLHLEGTSVEMKKIKITTSSSGPPQSSSVRNGISVSSDMITVSQLSYQCPKHHNLIDQRIFYWGSPWAGKKKMEKQIIYTLFAISCQSCPANMYTLTRGKTCIRNDISHRLNTCVERSNCTACPIGAYCSGNIIPIDNHWGGFKKKGQLAFVQCPNGFCCSSQSTRCSSYNTCKKGRSGTLCGACAGNYTLTFTSSDCVVSDGGECDQVIFIVYFLGLSFV